MGRPPLRPSSNNFTFPIEEYASMRELCALAELVGPEGIDYINKKLIKILIMLSSAIKVLLKVPIYRCIDLYFLIYLFFFFL